MTPASENKLNTPIPDLKKETGEEKLRKLAVGFIPGWDSRNSSGALSALLSIAGHYDDLVNTVLCDARNKAKLATLDAMGATLRPPAPSKAVVVFNAIETSSGETRSVPKGTLVAANADGGTVAFETEHAITLIRSRFDQVIDVINGKIYDRRTGGKELIQRESLFLAINYGLFPGSELKLKMGFEPMPRTRTGFAWQFWAGEWCDLKVTEDETDGGLHNGTIALTNDTKRMSLAAKVGSQEAHWIRLVPALGIADSKPLTEMKISISNLKVRTDLTDDSCIPPDLAFANQQKVDPLSVFAPFGESPRPGAALMFSSLGGFCRPNAKITLTFKIVPDAETKSGESQGTVAKVSGAVSGIKELSFNQPFKLVPIAHNLFKTTIPFYSMVTRVLYELADLVVSKIESSTKAIWEWIQQTSGFSDRQPEAISSSETVAPPDPSKSPNPDCPLNPVTKLEMWDGLAWTEIASSSDIEALRFCGKDTAPQLVNFTLPFAIPSSSFAGNNGLWMRIRFVSGGYGKPILIKETQSTFVDVKPPRIEALKIKFEHTDDEGSQFSFFRVNEVLVDESEKNQFLALRASITLCPKKSATFGDVIINGTYLGFDGPLPEGWVGCHLEKPGEDVESWNEQADSDSQRETVTCEIAVFSESLPETVDWKTIEKIEDRTAGLTVTGLLRLQLPRIQEAPTVSVASISLTRLRVASPYLFADTRSVSVFDSYRPQTKCLIRDEQGFEEIVIAAQEKDGWRLSQPLTRVFRQAELQPLRPELFGLKRRWLRVSRPDHRGDLKLLLNAAAVTQAESHTGEILGTSDGRPSQALRCRFTPVMEDETLEILELEDRRAELEYDLLKSDIEASGLLESIRVEREPVNGRINKVWIRWQRQDSFISSSPSDRHYIIDRNQGIIVFGGNDRGRIPPVHAQVVLSHYRHGGGRIGNVPAGSIQQILTPNVAVDSVTNPCAAIGGCDGDSLEESWSAAVTQPGLLAESRVERFLRQNTLFRAVEPAALQADDYATLVRRASSQVAEAIVLPRERPPLGQSLNIHLVVLLHDYRAGVMPGSNGTVLFPEALKIEIVQHVAALSPAWVASRLTISAPSIVKFDVEIIVSDSLSQIDRDITSRKVGEWIDAIYFDGVSGGPQGRGWLSSESQIVREAALLQRLIDVDRNVLECRITCPASKVQGTSRIADTLPTLAPGAIPALRTLTLRSSREFRSTQQQRLLQEAAE